MENESEIKDITMRKTMAVIGALTDHSKWENGSAFPYGIKRTGHVFKGGAGITTDATCRSAVVAFCPELAARAARSHAMVYQRNAAGAVISATSLTVGPELSKQFCAMGVASGTLKVRNASAKDGASGSIRGTCLYDTDKPVWEMSRTDLEAYAMDEVAISSADEGGVCIAAIPPEIGAHAAKVRQPVIQALSLRSSNDPGRAGFSHSGTTEVLNVFNDSDAHRDGLYGGGGITITGDASFTLFDTRAGTTVGATFRQGTFSGWSMDSNTYRIKGNFNCTLVNSGAGTARVTVQAIAMDAAGNDIVTVKGANAEGSDLEASPERSPVDISFDMEADVPIADIRVNVSLTNVSGSVVYYVKSAAGTLSLVTNDADIPDTPMAVAVIEGLSGNDSLDVGASTFIYGTLTADQANLLRNRPDDEIYDSSLARSIIDLYAQTIPHAWKMEDYGAHANSMMSLAADPSFEDAFSWKDFKKIARRVKSGIHTVAKHARQISGLASAMGVPGAALLDTGLRGVERVSAGLKAAEL